MANYYGENVREDPIKGWKKPVPFSEAK